MEHTKVAQAILKEIPLGGISKFLTRFESNHDKVAMGDGCGGGCGGGAGCIDAADHLGLTDDEILSAKKDISGLKATMKKAVVTLIK
jgi:hypothetical protein